MAKTIEGLYYSESHEYVRIEGEYGYIGITDYAQHALGHVVYVDMPEVDDEVEAGSEFGAVESVKAASDLNSPVSGTVVEVFAVRAPDDSVRLALNTCQVCNGSPYAYSAPANDAFVCQNCKNRFASDDIGKQSGGCNPVPITGDFYTEENGVITFDFISSYATGIREVSTNHATTDGIVYSINGQRLGTSVKTLQPGIYVRNGKKFVVK